MDDRTRAWLKLKCGKFSSSGASALLTGGKGKIEWGDVAIGYLYSKRYERRTGRPIRNEENRNFKWGHAQEGLLVEWLRENKPYAIRYCASEEDYPDGIFLASSVHKNCCDSPDFFADSNFVGEGKCVISQPKFERLTMQTRGDVLKEYSAQFAWHLWQNPDREQLMYVLYDGIAEEEYDEYPDLDPMSDDRGKVFLYNRSEFTGLIERIEARVEEADSAVIQSLRTGEKIERILIG